MPYDCRFALEIWSWVWICMPWQWNQNSSREYIWMRRIWQPDLWEWMFASEIEIKVEIAIEFQVRACNFDFDSHSKTRSNSNDSPQLLSPESAPSRRPRQDVTALRAQRLPFWSYFLHTASGRPRQDSRMEDGRPNGGLTPPWTHQQSPDLPPGPPSSEHQILKVKVIWRPVIFIRQFHRPKIENLSGSKIFDPSQEGYLLISRISNSELIAKRWRSTVPAPGPVRVSPLWQPRWA